MKKALLFVVLAALAAEAFNQEQENSETSRSDFIISANISSGAAFLSLDFEKLVFLEPDRILAIGVGFGFNQEFQIFTTSEGPTDYFMLPHHITYNWGKSKSFFEMGLGASWVSGDRQSWYLVYPMVGYRYHPFKNPGFSFKAWVYFPFGQKFITDYNEILFSPLGLSFGIAL